MRRLFLSLHFVSVNCVYRKIAYSMFTSFKANVWDPEDLWNAHGKSEEYQCKREEVDDERMNKKKKNQTHSARIMQNANPNRKECNTARTAL